MCLFALLCSILIILITIIILLDRWMDGWMVITCLYHVYTMVTPLVTVIFCCFWETQLHSHAVSLWLTIANINNGWRLLQKLIALWWLLPAQVITHPLHHYMSNKHFVCLFFCPKDGLSSIKSNNLLWGRLYWLIDWVLTYPPIRVDYNVWFKFFLRVVFAGDQRCSGDFPLVLHCWMNAQKHYDKYRLCAFFWAQLWMSHRAGEVILLCCGVLVSSSVEQAEMQTRCSFFTSNVLFIFRW